MENEEFVEIEDLNSLELSSFEKNGLRSKSYIKMAKIKRFIFFFMQIELDIIR